MKIHVTNEQDNKYFNGKMPTTIWGFCVIDRKVRNIEEDEFGGFTGQIKTPNGVVTVESIDGEEWEIA